MKFPWSSSCLLVLNAKYLVCYIWGQIIFLDCTATLLLVTLKIHPKAPAGHNLVQLQVNDWLPLKTGRGRRGYKHTWQVRTIWARRTIKKKKKGSKINTRHWKKNGKQEINISQPTLEKTNMMELQRETEKGGGRTSLEGEQQQSLTAGPEETSDRFGAGTDAEVTSGGWGTGKLRLGTPLWSRNSGGEISDEAQ